MNKTAKDFNSQGLEQVKAGRLDAAVDFFTKAIDADPTFLEAYKNRGETLIKLNRVAEGEKDIQIAEGTKKQPQKTVTKQKKAVQKYNLHEADDLFGTLLSDEGPEIEDDEMFGLDDFLYDDTLPEAAPESEQVLDMAGGQFDVEDLLAEDTYYEGDIGNGEVAEAYDEVIEDLTPPYDETSSAEVVEEEQPLETVAEQVEEEDLGEEIPSEDETVVEHVPVETEPVSEEPAICSAMLEFIGGMQQEVAHARLFEPEENSLVLVDEETSDEAIVFFDQLTCLRVSSLPARFTPKREEPWTKEIIETIDGNTYHELVPSDQLIEKLLVCYSPDDQAPFPVALYPRSHIKKRTQDRPLTDILVEKRFISKVMLQRAIQESEIIKEMSLEKIIAEKARIPLAEIEEAIDQAQKGHMQGMQKEEILLFSGLVTEGDILYAVERFENIKNLTIDQFLIEKGYVKEREYYISLAEKHNIPFLDLTGRKFSKQSLTCLPRGMVVKHEILPLALKDDTLLIATHIVDMEDLNETIRKTAGCKHVKYVLSPPSQIKKIIKLLHDKRK